MGFWIDHWTQFGQQLQPFFLPGIRFIPCCYSCLYKSNLTNLRENVQLDREDCIEYGYDIKGKAISQTSKNCLLKFSVSHNS